MKKFNYLLILLLLISVISSCTKENPLEELVKYSDDIHGRKVIYTVTVLPADKFSKNELFQDTVFVSLIMNDSLIRVECDKMGNATFDNLPTGNVSVLVNTSGYVKTYYTADLSLRDSTQNTDSENIRRASSTILLYPKTGNGTAKLTVNAFADTDLTQSGTEKLTNDFAVFFSICENKNSYTHIGEGQITNLNYEVPLESTTQYSNGLRVDLPAALSGLKICINADDISLPQKQLDGLFIEKVYKMKTDTLTVISGKSYFYDLNFENN